MALRGCAIVLACAFLANSVRAAEEPHACGLPQYFTPFVEALPGRVITLSGESADTFSRVAELSTKQGYERLVVLLYEGSADVLTVVSRGNLVCAKRISVPRDKAQWGINMAFGRYL
jgi:hypothetical protein